MNWDDVIAQGRACQALSLMTKKDLRYFKSALLTASVWVSMIRLGYQLGMDSGRLLDQAGLVSCELDGLARAVELETVDDEGGVSAGCLLMISEINRKRVSAGRLVAMLRRQL